MSLSRRAFMTTGSTLIATVAVSRVAWSDPPMLAETDPTAVALGYKANASTVDKTKFPRYAAGQSCATCVLYQGVAGRPSGPCAVFAGKSVAAEGWCSSYAKKP
jgi:High potential iron-sulfur protein